MHPCISFGCITVSLSCDDHISLPFVWLHSVIPLPRIVMILMFVLVMINKACGTCSARLKHSHASIAGMAGPKQLRAPLNQSLSLDSTDPPY